MITVKVGNDTVKFPDGTPHAEIKAALDKHYGKATAPSAANPPPAPAEGPGFLGRTAQTAVGAVRDAYGDYFDGALGDKNPIAGAMAGGGEIAEGVGEIAQDAYKSFVPDVIQEKVSQGVDWLGNTAPVKKGMELAGELGDKYSEFKADNPELGEKTDKAIDYIGNATQVAALATPNPFKVTTRTNTAKSLSAINKAGMEQTRRAKVIKMLEPPNKKGLGNLNVDAKGNHIYEPSKWELDVADEITKIKDLKPNASFAKNHNVLREQASKIREEMERKIQRAGNNKIDMDALDAKLEYIADNLNEMPGGFALVGDSSTAAKNLLTELRGILKKSDGTAIGVLEARREFDQAVRNAFGNIFDANKETAKTIANKWIRDTLNDAVDKASPGVNVRAALDRQHKLLYAADDLLAKGFQERDTIVGRLIQNVENKVGLKLPTTPLALGATAAAGAGVVAGAPAAAAVGIGFGTLLAGYKGAKWLGSPPGRQWAINVIKAIEKDPLLTQALKADRIALMGIIEAGKDKEEN